MKLYLAPHACSKAVDIVAREVGIPLEYVWVDIRNQRLPDGGDYRCVNPKGQVPALETDDGEVLTDGGVILQYLADGTSGHGLLVSELSLDRYRVLEWLGFVSAELHKGFSPLFKADTPAKYREMALANIVAWLAWLDDVLSTRDYLHGGAFTVADAYCYTIVMWSELHDIGLSRWPHLVGYLGRIGRRPSVQAAREAEQRELASRGSA